MIKLFDLQSPSSIFYPPSSGIRQPVSLFKTALLLFLITLLLSSCTSTLHIEKPPESYNPGNLSLKYSYINIPVEFNVKNLELLVNRQLSGLIYADTSFENNGKDNLMIKAWKMGDFRLSMIKNELYYKIPLRLWIKKKFDISSFGITLSDTKEVNAEIALKFRTRVTVNKNWSLSTLTFSDGYEWITTPQLKLGPVNVPIPYLADLLVQSNQQTVNKEIDRALQSLLDLRQYIATIWTDLQKPIQVSTEYPLWARITPVELSTVPLTGSSSGIINQSIGIKAITELYYGKAPEYTVNSTLPDIKILSRLENSFSINLPIDIPFEQINELARQQMTGYKIIQGKYTITVNDLSVYGNDDNLVVAVKVSGSVNGTIYLAGKPYYDKDSSSVRIRDLDFDIRTKNVLIKSASWLFRHGLVETLQKSLVFPVGPQLQQARNEVRSYLEQQRKLELFTISGSIRNLDIDGIAITSRSVKVICVLEGILNVKLETE